MKLLLDEMYPARLAEALRGANIEAVIVIELALAAACSRPSTRLSMTGSSSCGAPVDRKPRLADLRATVRTVGFQPQPPFAFWAARRALVPPPSAVPAAKRALGPDGAVG